jgi:hypothetical protein
MARSVALASGRREKSGRIGGGALRELRIAGTGLAARRLVAPADAERYSHNWCKLVYTNHMGSAAVASVDGRRARSVKTREAIVDAFFALIDAGDPKPTAAAVAARAGLSVRSVFQHFADLEDLLLAVSDRQTNRIASLYTGVQYDGELSSRIGTFVDYRARLFETIAPLRRAAQLPETV